MQESCKKTKRLRRMQLLVLVGVMLTTILLAGCGGSEPTETTFSEAEIWGTAPAETLGIAVENAYKTFYYPQEWENKVEEVRTEDGANCTVTFQTKISGKEVVLFSVVMGPDEAEGYLLGQLKDEATGMINVYSVMNEADPEAWSEEEYSEICALQERVNDIIVQFFEDERFVPNR